MARPPDTGERRHKRLEIRLSEGELAELLDGLPDETGLGSWVRERALEAKRRESPERPDRP